MKNHGLWMIICCVLPLLLIFLLPALGVGSGTFLVVIVTLCFGLYLFMMKGHQGNDDDNHGDKKEGGHGSN